MVSHWTGKHWIKNIYLQKYWSSVLQTCRHQKCTLPMKQNDTFCTLRQNQNTTMVSSKRDASSWSSFWGLLLLQRVFQVNIYLRSISILLLGLVIRQAKSYFKRVYILCNIVHYNRFCCKISSGFFNLSDQILLYMVVAGCLKYLLLSLIVNCKGPITRSQII